jgi:hypothetical protein
LNSYIKNDRKLFKEEKEDVVRLIKNPAKIPELITPANLKPIEQIFKKNSQDFIITKETISSIVHLQLRNKKHSIQLNGAILDITIKQIEKKMKKINIRHQQKFIDISHCQ